MASIKANDLRTALQFERLRQFTNGGTCRLCVMTAAPTIDVDCHRRQPTPTHVAAARRYGVSKITLSPIRRGHIAELVERVRLWHGLPEVRKTWGIGLRALLAEPQHILHGGKSSKGGAA